MTWRTDETEIVRDIGTADDDAVVTAGTTEVSRTTGPSCVVKPNRAGSPTAGSRLYNGTARASGTGSCEDVRDDRRRDTDTVS